MKPLTAGATFRGGEMAYIGPDGRLYLVGIGPQPEVKLIAAGPIRRGDILARTGPVFPDGDGFACQVRPILMSEFDTGPIRPIGISVEDYGQGDEVQSAEKITVSGSASAADRIDPVLDADEGGSWRDRPPLL
jgi:hypothetical protein